MKRLRELDFWILLFVLAIALALRLWGIGFGLPHRYHIDEPPYVLAALRIAIGDLYITYPYNSPNLFQFLLTILYGIWYAAGWLVGAFRAPSDLASLYRLDPTGFYLLARGLSALFSTFTVALVYCLGRTISGRWVGLIAAGFLALTFSHAREGHYALTDSLVTALTTASLLGTVSFARSHRMQHLLLAGLAGGMAVGIKYLPGPVLLPPLVATLIAQRSWGSDKAWAKRFKMFAVLGGSAAVGFVVAFPAPLLNWSLFQVQWRQTWAQASGPLGNIQVDSAIAPLYYLKTLVWGLGAPLFFAAVTGLLLWLWRRRPTAYGYVFLFVVAYFVGINLVQTTWARYALPLVPPLVLFAAEAVVQLTRSLRKPVGKRRAVLIGLLVSVGIVVAPAARLIRHNWLLTQTNTRTLAKEWIEAHIPDGTRLAIQWYGPALSTADDPEPDTRRVYDIVSIHPFDTEATTYDLDAYRSKGISYLVVNSWGMGFQLKDPAQNRLRQDFYARLPKEAVCVARFRPTSADEPVPFVFEQIHGPYTSLWQIVRPGPEIIVYSLEQGSTPEANAEYSCAPHP